MNIHLKYIIFLYIVLFLLLYFCKPQLFVLDIDNRKRKFLYLTFLIVIMAIICFYLKVWADFFL